MKYNWYNLMLMSKHEEVYQRIESVLEEENDWVAAMATVACELHNSFNHFHWTGFYRDCCTKSAKNRTISRRSWLSSNSL